MILNLVLRGERRAWGYDHNGGDGDDIDDDDDDDCINIFTAYLAH
jgi:hypothetical protein